MKKLTLAVLAFVLLVPFVDAASGVKAQTYIDSMVTSNINIRRREAVYKSRSHWRKRKAVRKNAKKKIVRRKRYRG